MHHITRHTRAAAVAGLALAALTTLSACGSSGSSGSAAKARDAAASPATASPSASATASGNAAYSASELARRAAEAVGDGALNVMIGGVLDDGGRLDVTGCMRGGTDARLVGTMSDGHVELVMVDGHGYVKADLAVYEAMSDSGPLNDAQRAVIERAMGGKYMDLEDDDDTDGTTSVTDLTNLADLLRDNAADATKGETTTVDGRAVIPLVVHPDTDTTTTLYVPVDGDPFPFRVTERVDNSSENTVIRLSHADAPCSVTAPNPDDVVPADRIEAVMQKAAEELGLS
ncbi:MAG: hypothetical protein HOV66_16380 [Streptomycetaceae bacterium]|nr:hypothetical protein [Streptomycetaceae bacterium]